MKNKEITELQKYKAEKAANEVYLENAKKRMAEALLDLNNEIEEYLSNPPKVYAHKPWYKRIIQKVKALFHE